MSTDEAEKITKEITQLTEQLSQVFANKDFDHLKRIWADDFSYTIPGGIVSDKRTGLANVTDKSGTITSAALVAFKAHVYGKNLAIVAMEATMKQAKTTMAKRSAENFASRMSGCGETASGKL